MDMACPENSSSEDLAKENYFSYLKLRKSDKDVKRKEEPVTYRRTRRKLYKRERGQTTCIGRTSGKNSEKMLKSLSKTENALHYSIVEDKNGCIPYKQNSRNYLIGLDEDYQENLNFRNSTISSLKKPLEKVVETTSLKDDRNIPYKKRKLAKILPTIKDTKKREFYESISNNKEQSDNSESTDNHSPLRLAKTECNIEEMIEKLERLIPNLSCNNNIQENCKVDGQSSAIISAPMSQILPYKSQSFEVEQQVTNIEIIQNLATYSLLKCIKELKIFNFLKQLHLPPTKIENLDERNNSMVTLKKKTNDHVFEFENLLNTNNNTELVENNLLKKWRIYLEHEHKVLSNTKTIKFLLKEMEAVSKQIMNYSQGVMKEKKGIGDDTFLYRAYDKIEDLLKGNITTVESTSTDFCDDEFSVRNSSTESEDSPSAIVENQTSNDEQQSLIITEEDFLVCDINEKSQQAPMLITEAIENAETKEILDSSEPSENTNSLNEKQIEQGHNDEPNEILFAEVQLPAEDSSKSVNNPLTIRKELQKACFSKSKGSEDLFIYDFEKEDPTWLNCTEVIINMDNNDENEEIPNFSCSRHFGFGIESIRSNNEEVSLDVVLDTSECGLGVENTSLNLPNIKISDSSMETEKQTQTEEIEKEFNNISLLETNLDYTITRSPKDTSEDFLEPIDTLEQLVCEAEEKKNKFKLIKEKIEDFTFPTGKKKRTSTEKDREESDIPAVVCVERLPDEHSSKKSKYQQTMTDSTSRFVQTEIEAVDLRFWVPDLKLEIKDEIDPEVENNEFEVVHYKTATVKPPNYNTISSANSPEKQYCMFCNMGYINGAFMNKHIQNCKMNPKNIIKKTESPALFYCKYCNFGIINQSLFEEHEQKCRDTLNSCVPAETKEDTPKIKKTSPKKFKCSSCEYSTNNSGHLTIHKRIHDDTPLCVCDICRKGFSRYDSLKMHMFRHMNIAEEITVLKEVPLSIEDYTKQILQLKIMNKFYNVVKLSCSKCDYETPIVDCMDKHFKTVHLNVFNFSCQLCGFSTKSKNNLKQHMNYHFRENVHKCSYCSYETINKSYVKKHENQVHLKAITYPCDYCDFVTYRKENVKAHINNVHLKEKKYSCDKCEYFSFAQSNLLNHVRAVHEGIKRKKKKDGVFNSF